MIPLHCVKKCSEIQIEEWRTTLTQQQTDKLTERPTDRPIDQETDKLTEPPTDGPTDWQTDRLNEEKKNAFLYKIDTEKLSKTADMKSY